MYNRRKFPMIVYVIFSVKNYDKGSDLTYHFRNISAIKADDINKALFLLNANGLLEIELLGKRLSYTVCKFEELNQAEKRLCIDTIHALRTISFPKTAALAVGFNVDAFCVTSKSDKSELMKGIKKRLVENKDLQSEFLRLEKKFESESKRIWYNKQGWYRDGKILNVAKLKLIKKASKSAKAPNSKRERTALTLHAASGPPPNKKRRIQKDVVDEDEKEDDANSNNKNHKNQTN